MDTQAFRRINGSRPFCTDRRLSVQEGLFVQSRYGGIPGIRGTKGQTHWPSMPHMAVTCLKTTDTMTLGNTLLPDRAMRSGNPLSKAATGNNDGTPL